MKHKKYYLTFIMISSLTFSCTAINEYKLKKNLNYSQDSSQYILNELKTKKIIFLGENHSIVNEELFLSKNLKPMYNAGLRYIFLESRYVETFPGDSNYFFYMFYPWVGAGWKYELLDLYQSIIKFNKNLPEENKIKIIVPEEGRNEFQYNDPRINQEFINYRDDYAFNEIVEVLKQSSINEKAIILYGANHSIKKSYKDQDFVRYPLGYLLTLKYGNKLGSYRWFTNDDFFDSNFFSNTFWKNNIKTSLLIKSKYLSNIDKKNYHDGIIIEDESIYGSFHQYVPTKENILYMINFIKNYKIISKNDFNGTNPNSQFLKSIYYLKLYYPKTFKYSLWGLNNESLTDKSLLKSLELLEDEILKGVKSSVVNYALNNKDKIQKFHKYMIYSNIEDFLRNYKVSNIEYYCNLAEEEFPYDIWPLYWKAFYQTENNNYQAALNNWEKLFNNPISTCLETLPLSYKKAAICALELGDNEKYKKYENKYKSLKNEFDIETNGYYYTGNLY